MKQFNKNFSKYCKSVKATVVAIIVSIFLPLFISCGSSKTTTIVGGEYNEAKDITEYFVFPYGNVSLPGKWEKHNYVNVSRQQFFMNEDSVIVAVAFGRYDSYEFNQDGKLKGFDFIKAMYEWDSTYFQDTFGFQIKIVEIDDSKNYIIYNISNTQKENTVNTFILIGENNGNVSNFSVNYTDKWTEDEKIQFLKNLYQ